MIEQLHLGNFKAFASLAVPLGRYSLLSGLNSSGKSTVLQSLALLRQAAESADGNMQDLSGIPLNGDLVELGTGQDDSTTARSAPNQRSPSRCGMKAAPARVPDRLWGQRRLPSRH